jgi:hypothetical protein
MFSETAKVAIAVLLLDNAKSGARKGVKQNPDLSSNKVHKKAQEIVSQ